ncbi:FeoB-associated Cys-rich membrane protein [Aminicella lysinilytica]|uniref:Attachment p12 family protein n=1 Tax=Aminicella lysinilytica TaxID=433323 RepID=A0A4R6PWP5_9FIRM|nr:FeoB-associated Cys-rich membrane protein [Aminicella lysinilytica]TDP46638.1 attachment p12 family protein [Aminicella lysinilytica]
MAWIIANAVNIVVCAVLALLVLAVVIRMIRNKKSGRTSCGCDCGSCPMSGNCHGGESR